jgi:hypothetical protein
MHRRRRAGAVRQLRGGPAAGLTSRAAAFLPMKRKLVRRIKLIGPSGKSFLIYANRVKPKNKQNQKYFALSEVKNRLYKPPSSPAQSNCAGSRPVIGRPQGWRWRAPACGG